MAKAYVEHLTIVPEDISGAIGVVTIGVYYRYSSYSLLPESGYSQGSAIEIAHSPIEVATGVMVAKAGKNKGVIDFPLLDFIGCLNRAPGRI